MSKHGNRSSCRILSCLTLSVLLIAAAAYGEWQPAKGPLMTRWSKDVTPDNAHREYPRPQMVREEWLNLNGLWDYAIRPLDPNNKSRPQTFDGKILVPYPVESALSGVIKSVGKDDMVWYRRSFEVPAAWKGKRVLLNFGAVDWETTVWVNGKEAGTHRGGYDPFTFEITDALKSSGSQEIVISVWDPTDEGTQPRGKQTRKPRGIWYTAVTGIWQTVWVEPVEKAYIESFRIVTDIDNEVVKITAKAAGGLKGLRIEVEGSAPAFWTGKVSSDAEKEVQLSVKNARLWSPDSPYLYDLRLWLRDSSGKTLDSIKSYFGMRKISVAKDKEGINRLFLNNKAVFQYGPLDQGWWPDGLYAAPSDEALRYDIEMLKELGCNMMRKHVKIEPERFYYWCDKLGLLVWQDMPSGDKYIRRKDADIERTEESTKQFEFELGRMVDVHRNSPAIVMWVAFNEGWGQYDTAKIVDMIKKWDPTRLVDNASGWADRGIGDVNDIHKYPGPAAPRNEERRAAVLGEFGGLGLPVKGHTWQEEKNWGYRKYSTQEELTEAYLGLIEKLRPLVTQGLSAAVYTQTTDVEIEVNGLMPYDRSMVKMDAAKITAANKSLYGAMP